MTIINDILDFSKIEAGQLHMDAIDFDRRESLGEAVASLAMRADDKNLELIYDVAAETPEAVIGDPGRLRQVVLNLVRNAIKFTNRGEIEVQLWPEQQTDDHVLIHCSALRLLAKRGCHVQTAMNGKQAVSLFESQPFDLVLMDLQLPVMDGITAAKSMRAIENGADKRVPIYALTAHAMKEDETRCLAAGMDGYLSKPLKSAALLELIDRLSDSKSVTV